MGITIGILWFLIIVVIFLLMGIILLQEGKGGGLGGAFGGAGAETFGVKATGVNRFTGILGGVFIVLALLINFCMKFESDQEVDSDGSAVEAAE